MRDLLGYFDDLISILLAVDPQSAFIRGPSVDVRDNHLGELSCDISYADGSQLHVDLKADCSDEFPVLDAYRFHYFHSSEGLRFRHDNAPHYHGLPNFPHHLHLSTEEVLPLGPPSVRGVAAAVQWHLHHPSQAWRPTSY